MYWHKLLLAPFLALHSIRFVRGEAVSSPWAHVISTMPKVHVRRRLRRVSEYVRSRFAPATHAVPFQYDALPWASGAADACVAAVSSRERWMGERGIVVASLDEYCPVACAAKEDTCAICMEEIAVGESVRLLKCKHLHHRACLEVWLAVSPKCPVCSDYIGDLTENKTQMLQPNLSLRQRIGHVHSSDSVERACASGSAALTR